MCEFEELASKACYRRFRRNGHFKCQTGSDLNVDSKIAEGDGEIALHEGDHFFQGLELLIRHMPNIRTSENFTHDVRNCPAKITPLYSEIDCRSIPVGIQRSKVSLVS